MSSQLEAKQRSHVKVALASLIGTAIEWYDFFLYGTAAALIFNKLFFPTFDPTVGTLLAFATYALGFVARPLGGLVFGHYGDRIGRKTMLYLTLLIMGAATTVIGILPTYETLGIWAAILLIACRLIQGFGLGGEWGGAVLMAVEHAPEDRRGFYGSWPQLGAPLGLVLGTLVFSIVSSLMTDAQLYAWGWRLPFLFSIVLVIVGLWIRFTIAESAHFRTVSGGDRCIFSALFSQPRCRSRCSRCSEPKTRNSVGSRSSWAWLSATPPCTVRRRASSPNCSGRKCATAACRLVTILRRSSPERCRRSSLLGS